MSRSRWLLLVAVLFMAWQGWSRYAAPVDSDAVTGVVSASPILDQRPAVPLATTDPEPAVSGEPDVAVTTPGMARGEDDLPPEAHDTLRLIASGGPFPYERDGVRFGNHEKQLPGKPRGYYREYTVSTPGLHHRGARRIITGGDPPEVFYYTDDHYRTFREIDGGEIGGQP